MALFGLVKGSTQGLPGVCAAQKGTLYTINCLRYPASQSSAGESEDSPESIVIEIFCYVYFRILAAS